MIERITADEVRHIAQLARLALTENESETMSVQLSQIISYVEKMNELDTSNVAPTSHVLPLQNVMRDDVVSPCLSREEALLNAPEATEDFFRVPRIID